MNKTLLIGAVILAFTAFAFASYLFLYRSPVPVQVLIEETPKGLNRYANPVLGLTFEYSMNYLLNEKGGIAGTSGDEPRGAIILVEDTQENRDLIEGRTTEARDGPTSINITIFPNPDRLNAEDWVRADTNWTVRTSEAAPIGRGRVTGVMYSWSGLYEGKTVIVTEGTRAYVFSVTWLEPSDPILTEFDKILESVELAP